MCLSSFKGDHSLIVPRRGQNRSARRTASGCRCRRGSWHGLAAGRTRQDAATLPPHSKACWAAADQRHIVLCAWSLNGVRSWAAGTVSRALLRDAEGVVQRHRRDSVPAISGRQACAHLYSERSWAPESEARTQLSECKAVLCRVHLCLVNSVLQVRKQSWRTHSNGRLAKRARVEKEHLRDAQAGALCTVPLQEAAVRSCRDCMAEAKARCGDNTCVKSHASCPGMATKAP